MTLITILLTHSLLASLSLTFLLLASYIIYQRFFHPLAKYPGPFLASLTDVWQVCQFLSLKQPYTLTALHEKYGSSFVRYGPDKLSVTCESAIPLMYQKGGRRFQKTEFYDAYGAAHPNVFGMRDEDQHSIRRRHMSHSFSMASVKEMEPYIDMNMKILQDKIARYAENGDAFDLKKAFHYYVIDTLGELAFSQSFGVQAADDDALVPPVKEHSLLAAAMGSWSVMLPTLKKLLPRVPVPSLQALYAARQACADLASRSVRKRLEDLADVKDDEAAIRSQRKDILTSLILAKHPDTGEKLSQTDLETEAFGFIIAGTHTTSATTTLLFYHLLHAPQTMARLVSELDTNLPPLESYESAYSITVAEASLPYLRNCIKENFRISPVFTMPLARRVMTPEGVVIDGEHIKHGTSIAVCNHAFHHNPHVWGIQHTLFDPDRWDDPTIAEKSKILMHFGLGGRQCIGKTIATTNIYKMSATLLREFEFELADPDERVLVDRGHFKGKLPRLVSVGISDLEEPLMVRVRRREAGRRSIEKLV